MLMFRTYDKPQDCSDEPEIYSAPLSILCVNRQALENKKFPIAWAPVSRLLIILYICSIIGTVVFLFHLSKNDGSGSSMSIWMGIPPVLFHILLWYSSKTRFSRIIGLWMRTGECLHYWKGTYFCSIEWDEYLVILMSCKEVSESQLGTLLDQFDDEEFGNYSLLTLRRWIISVAKKHNLLYSIGN